MLANSDIHNETIAAYNADTEKHRPLTLVFTTEKTKAGIREALFAGRTVGYFGDNLIGRELFLRPFFEAAIEVLTTEVPGDSHRVWLKIRNNSDMSFFLVPAQSTDGIQLPEKVVLKAGRMVRFLVKLDTEKFTNSENISIPFVVENLKILPDQGMPFDISVKLNRD
ncbi:hypothetical protein KAH55_14145, partial [bacterium]|nr:hypothetical protein [bacterium]